MLLFLFVGYFAKAQCPSVTISTPQKTYCESDFIEINATNIPNNAVAEWDLGSGFDTAKSNPYFGATNVIGKINAVLRLTLVDKTVCNYTENDIATVNVSPTANFEVSRTLLCNGADTITLIDKSTASISRKWKVGNVLYNNSSKIKTITLPGSGSYDVSLIIEDNNGCLGTKDVENMIVVYDDINLDFSKSNSSNCYPVVTDFNSSLNLKGQSVQSYAWDLPGSKEKSGNTQNLSNISYPSIGVFSAKLTVVTSEGCTYEKDKPNFMLLGDKPTLSVKVSKDSACLSEKIRIEQTNQPLPGSYTWGYDPSLYRNISRHEIEIFFKDTGNVNLNLIYNHNGCRAFLNKNNIVNIRGLKSDFEANDALHCEAPHTVHLKNKSDTSSAKIKGYQWFIIDSDTKTELSKSSQKDFDVKVTKAPSKYDVILITTSENGCSDTTIKNEFIQIQPYNFGFDVQPAIGCKLTQFKFVNKTVSSSYYGSDLYSWDFYNKDKSKILGSSGAASPTFNYSDTGYFPVQLTAANPLGCQEKFMLDSALRVVTPYLDYNWMDSIACMNDAFTLKSSSLPLDDRLKSKYRFTHRQSKTETFFEGDDIQATLTEPGIYDVSYQYSSSSLCSDSIVKSFYVNGLIGKIDLSSTSGCTPLDVKPTFSASMNYHLGDPDTSLSYYWEVFPKDGAKLFGASEAKPKLRLEKNGTYKLGLYVTNSTGCVIYLESDPIIAGLESRVQANIPRTCVGDSILLFNKSTNTPSFLKWTLLQPSKGSLDSIDFDTRRFIAKDSGKIDIQLVAGKNGVCVDTVIFTVDVDHVKAKFSSKDTSLSCSPVEALFENLSENADSLWWNFGDGNSIKVNAKDSTIHEYQFNSGPKGYDVTLVAQSERGCTDTLHKVGLVKINGPVATFEMTDSTGCEPIVVKFKNTSKNYVDFYFDYGDGSKIDTNTISDKTYLTNDQLYEFIYPVLTIVDANGCKASSEPVHQVEVYSYPEGKIVIEPDTLVCQRQDITVRDTGRFGRHYSWYLDNQLVSIAKEDTFNISKVGTTKLKVGLRNRFGCTDTFYQDIHTKPSPELSFNIPEFICLNSATLITVDVKGSAQPLSYSWTLGELINPDNVQSTTVNRASISYTSPGKKTIEVVANMPNGCAVPYTTDLEVFDPANSPDADIVFAGFNDQNQVIVKYPSHNFDYFREFEMHKNGVLHNILPENNQEQLVDASVDLGIKNCYELAIVDQCGNTGSMSKAHCPIQLKAASTVPGEVVLDWTFYVGWNHVDAYEIYRAKESGPYTKIAEVFGTQKSYSDNSNLCNTTFRYKVVATNLTTKLSTSSNWVEIVPDFEQNLNPIHVKNVSVLEDQTIRVDWEASADKGHVAYRIYKHENTLGNVVNDFTTNQTHLIDNEVNTVTSNYLYEVVDLDQCDNETPKGRHGKSVLLKGLNVEGQNTLVWNVYEDPSSPIIEHHMEFVRPNESIHLKRIDPSIFTYEDGATYDDVNGFYPFRVYTIHSNQDTAYSNVARVTGEPLYYIPTAFSPNDDQTNETFELYTLFISNDTELSEFELKIFSRWGNKVFESQDLRKHWDGTLDGDILPSGPYIYQLKMTAASGQIIYKNGTVYLMR